jgi:hypothetical protein
MEWLGVAERGGELTVKVWQSLQQREKLRVMVLEVTQQSNIR